MPQFSLGSSGHTTEHNRLYGALLAVEGAVARLLPRSDALPPIRVGNVAVGRDPLKWGEWDAAEPTPQMILAHTSSVGAVLGAFSPQIPACAGQTVRITYDVRTVGTGAFTVTAHAVAADGALSTIGAWPIENLDGQWQELAIALTVPFDAVAVLTSFTVDGGETNTPTLQLAGAAGGLNGGTQQPPRATVEWLSAG